MLLKTILLIRPFLFFDTNFAINIWWSRARFTLDEGLSQDQTALSDLEVDFLEIEGELTQIRYPLIKEQGTDEKSFIEIATTRPETLLGDTAIVVHPEDKRYRHLIGKKVIVPLVEREVFIIADESCDPEFGTGAVKITPAHDPNDFILGKKTFLRIYQYF